MSAPSASLEHRAGRGCSAKVSPEVSMACTGNRITVPDTAMESEYNCENGCGLQDLTPSHYQSDFLHGRADAADDVPRAQRSRSGTVRLVKVTGMAVVENSGERLSQGLREMTARSSNWQDLANQRCKLSLQLQSVSFLSVLLSLALKLFVAGTYCRRRVPSTALPCGFLRKVVAAAGCPCD